MFIIHHYEQTNQYKFTSLRTERIKRQKRIERTLKILTIVGTIGAILFLTAVLGYIGEQDREYELINAGYSQQEASK